MPSSDSLFNMYAPFGGDAEAGDDLLTKRFIKEVKYVLHPTYKVNKITITEPPFLLSRVAYGSFNIEVTVVFQAWTKQKPVSLNHMLIFENEGKSFCRFIDGDSTSCHKNPNTIGTKDEKKTLDQVVKALTDIEEENQKEMGGPCATQ